MRFDPQTAAFTNTVTLFFPRDDLSDFPFDLLVLSRVYRFFYAVALRMGILNKERSHLYPKNLSVLPWNDALRSVAAHIEGLRQPLLDVSLRAFRANEALRQELARIACQPFQRACLEDPSTRVEWSASLQASGYEFTVRTPVCTASGDATRVQVSESEQDWLEVNVADIADRLCLALRSTEGQTLTQRELLTFPIPADGAAADQYKQVLTMASSHDHERDLEAVIDQLDRMIGPALGLDDADLDVIQEECRTDPLLSKIYPRYPYSETRRHGFRTNLDRHDRYR